MLSLHEFMKKHEKHVGIVAAWNLILNELWILDTQFINYCPNVWSESSDDKRHFVKLLQMFNYRTILKIRLQITNNEEPDKKKVTNSSSKQKKISNIIKNLIVTRLRLEMYYSTYLIIHSKNPKSSRGKRKLHK